MCEPNLRKLCKNETEQMQGSNNLRPRFYRSGNIENKGKAEEGGIILTNDDIKRMLYNYTKYDKWIADCEKELQEMQDKISVNYDVGISAISDMPHGTGISDKTCNAAGNVEKLKETFAEQVEYTNKRIKHYYKEKREIEKIVDSLKPVHREIAEKKYFQNLSRDKIMEIDKQKNPYTWRGLKAWYVQQVNMFKAINKFISSMQ